MGQGRIATRIATSGVKSWEEQNGWLVLIRSSVAGLEITPDAQAFANLEQKQPLCCSRQCRKAKKGRKKDDLSRSKGRGAGRTVASAAEGQLRLW